jgi:hypothetical protein
MGHKENKLKCKRLLNLKPSERLFRINAGMAWTGTDIIKKGKFLIIKNPYPFHGAPTGWPDLCGWTEITITPEMVGQKVAVFTAEEIKATGTLSTDQKKFRKIIERMGGIFKVLTS